MTNQRQRNRRVSRRNMRVPRMFYPTETSCVTSVLGSTSATSIIRPFTALQLFNNPTVVRIVALRQVTIKVMPLNFLNTSASTVNPNNYQLQLFYRNPATATFMPMTRPRMVSQVNETTLSFTLPHDVSQTISNTDTTNLIEARFATPTPASFSTRIDLAAVAMWDQWLDASTIVA
jgi:hypothetical protein